MGEIRYEHFFVDHVDEPVRLNEGVGYRVTETTVHTETGDLGVTTIKFMHRVVAL
jgi:hypothetical protein